MTMELQEKSPHGSAELAEGAAQCEIFHHFGPSIYIREAHMPAGMFVMGWRHKNKNMNYLVKGSVAVKGPYGELQILKAPLMFNCNSGQKFIYTLENTVWQNIISTELTSVDAIESVFVDKDQDTLENFNSMKTELTNLIGKRLLL